jgi:hypothetical protein
LNHFVYQNFNSDEKRRMVFDGIMANCPGAGKGLFNSRFAQFTRHGSHHEDNLYPVDFFPFTTVPQYDPITGKKGDAFNRARKSGFLAKMFFINSSTDYWTRAASLLHTDVQGKKDAKIDTNVRIYAIAGGAHTHAPVSLNRALLTALDQWVSYNIEPPPSQIPKISDGTLVNLEQWQKKFPDIPGILKPPSFYHPFRLNMGPRWYTKGIADQVPPQRGPRYVCLVPQVDEDGNEIAGIRLPDIAVPLATFTGWSMRSPFFSNTLRRNAGRKWPFPITPEKRQKNGDPRKSILERYPSKVQYLSAVAKSVLNLKEQRFLLSEDLARLLKEAAERDYWPLDKNDSLVSIKEFTAQPSMVNRGETSILTVNFEGLACQIMSVRAIVREAPRVSLIFENNGRDDDKQAHNNVWTGKLKVVPDAAPGVYHLDIKAFDINWNPIYLSHTVKDGKGETAWIIITVK